MNARKDIDGPDDKTALGAKPYWLRKLESPQRRWRQRRRHCGTHIACRAVFLDLVDVIRGRWWSCHDRARGQDALCSRFHDTARVGWRFPSEGHRLLGNDNVWRGWRGTRWS